MITAVSKTLDNVTVTISADEEVGVLLRRLNRAVKILARVCPECGVDVGEAHHLDCPLRG